MASRTELASTAPMTAAANARWTATACTQSGHPWSGRSPMRPAVLPRRGTPAGPPMPAAAPGLTCSQARQRQLGPSSGSSGSSPGCLLGCAAAPGSFLQHSSQYSFALACRDGRFLKARLLKSCCLSRSRSSTASMYLSAGTRDRFEVGLVGFRASWQKRAAPKAAPKAHAQPRPVPCFPNSLPANLPARPAPGKARTSLRTRQGDSQAIAMR